MDGYYIKHGNGRSYRLNYEPVALARCRYSRGKVYDAQKQLKLVWGITIQQQHQDCPLFRGALHVELKFFFAPPVSRHGTKRLGNPHTQRPDLDNLCKLILDVCSGGILYHDDATIASLVLAKQWDVNPRTEIYIEEMKY